MHTVILTIFIYALIISSTFANVDTHDVGSTAKNVSRMLLNKAQFLSNSPIERKSQRHEKEAIQKRKKRPFQCFTCNTHQNADDTQPCVDKVESCADGVRSCSTVVFYTSVNDNVNGSKRVRHMRKFCTSPGTPLHEYLVNFPGSSFCQNINREITKVKTVEQPKLTRSTTEPPVIPDNTFNIELPAIDSAPRKEAVAKTNNKHGLTGPPSIRPLTLRKEEELTGKGNDRTKRSSVDAHTKQGPPAPPHESVSSVLCVCGNSLCNFGEFHDVFERSLLRNWDASIRK